MIWTSPHGFIKAALAAKDATVEDRYYVRQNRTLKVVGFTTMGKYRVTGEFNNDNLLERVITWVPNPVMGDMMVELRYSDYKDVGGGAKFPFRIHGHQGDNPLNPGGHNWIDVRVTDAKVNVANAAQAVPDNVRTAPAPQTRVTAQKLGGRRLADGRQRRQQHPRRVQGLRHGHRAAGGRGALERRDRRSQEDCPQQADPLYRRHAPPLGSHGRGANLRRGRRDRHRPGPRDKDFFEKVVLAPQSRTLEPDRLSQFPFAPTGPGPLTLQTFTDSTAISDGERSILLYHVENLNHADDMLVAYLPREKILINADLWGPPAAGAAPPANVNASAIALYSNIKRLKLDVAQHVPIHGNPGPNADFERIVGPAAARAPAAGGGG